MADWEINGNVNVGGGTMLDVEIDEKLPNINAGFNMNFGDGTVLRLRQTRTIEGVIAELGWPQDTPRDMFSEAVDVFLKTVGESDQEKEKILLRTQLAGWLQNTANVGNIAIAFKTLVDSGAMNFVRKYFGL